MDLETIKLKIRKNKDIIYMNGYGVLVFMLWSLIKIILYLVDIAPEVSPGVDDNLDIIYLSLVIASSVIDDAFTIITGLLAIRVGKNNKPHYTALIVLSIITCSLGLEFLVGDILLCVILASDTSATIIANILTDTFFLTMTVFLTISAFKLNNLRRLEKEATTNER
ncbi:MAG: hypothetical protein MJ214_04340 [Bacilli bacterium]|nr:hypothetical protein [Bacilli bacterium]